MVSGRHGSGSLRTLNHWLESILPNAKDINRLRPRNTQASNNTSDATKLGESKGALRTVINARFYRVYPAYEANNPQQPHPRVFHAMPSPNALISTSCPLSPAISLPNPASTIPSAYAYTRPRFSMH